MSRLFKVIALCIASVFLLSGTPNAEVVDVTVTIPIGATIGATASMTVNIRNISDDASAGSVGFSIGADPWTIADQYLQVIYNCNQPLWAVRIVTDNLVLYPGMAPKPLDPGPDGVFDTPDDIVSYGGLIDATTIDNPDNRADLAWQVYANPQVPGALTDATVGGLWNSDWAYVVDVSNTGYDPEVDSDGNPDTLAYPTIVQGGPAGNGLAFHPASGDPAAPDPKPGDGDVVVYLGARFGGLAAGNYGANLKVELIHE